MARPRGAPVEQPAVLEEDVHELPQHVVGRLGQLLGDERVVVGGTNSHAAPTAREGDGQAAGAAAPHGRATSARRRRPSRCRRARASSADVARRREPERRQRALADDHRVDELDRDVARRRCASAGDAPKASSRPPRAKRSAIAVAEPREPVGLGAEEARSPPGDARVDRRGGRRIRPAPPARSGSAASQSRSASTPSPVRALTRSRSTPGWTASRWQSKRSMVEVDVLEQVDLVDDHELAGAEHQRVLAAACRRPRRPRRP